MKKYSSYLSLLIYIAACMILITAILSISKNEFLTENTTDRTIQYSNTVVSDFLDSLSSNNMNETLKKANTIIVESTPYYPNLLYVQTAQNADINSNFFNPPFTELDYLYWKNALTLKRLSDTYKEKFENNYIKNLFLSINERIKNSNHKSIEKRTVFSYEIWENKEGDLLDKYILFSDIAEQNGYISAMLVIQNSNKEIIHILLETRDKFDTYTIDFKNNLIWNKSIYELDRIYIEKILGKELLKEINSSTYKFEFSPFSYRKINQQLFTYLSSNNESNVPIFGQDPLLRMGKFKSYGKNKGAKIDKAALLGIEPFLIMKNSPYFNKEWDRH